MRWLAVVAVGVLGVFGGSCTGMRPALDQAGPSLARSPEHLAEMRYLGDGCYVAGTTVFACSIDSLPAGEIVCAAEPDEDWYCDTIARARYRDGARELYYDRDLDSFVDRLNTRTCHERWYDTFAIAPVAITVRDVGKPGSRHTVPLRELGLTELPQTLEVSRATARQLCRTSTTTDRWLEAVCVDADGTATTDATLLRSGLGDVPEEPSFGSQRWFVFDFASMVEHTLHGTPSPSKRCAVVEVEATSIACRSVIPDAVPIGAGLTATSRGRVAPRVDE